MRRPEGWLRSLGKADGKNCRGSAAQSPGQEWHASLGSEEAAAVDDRPESSQLGVIGSLSLLRSSSLSRCGFRRAILYVAGIDTLNKSRVTYLCTKRHL
mmetsp:Transcript_68074/g.113200  ORF Transcript_68074/g.113200 Transcript_68074/m.113200 type:complete len:99 (+) Transcript_68074:1004-1300(+)